MVSRSQELSLSSRKHESGNALTSTHLVQAEKDELDSGTSLQEGHYILHKKQGRLQWNREVYETIWLASLDQHVPVTIYEIVHPEGNKFFQETIRPAIRALFSLQDIPHLPTVLQFFQDHHRSFFVFQQPSDGQSLLTLLQQRLPEKGALAYCALFLPVLDYLAEHSLVCGLRPEYIYVKPDGSCFFTHCSPLFIGGAMRSIQGDAVPYLSPYLPPDFSPTAIDSRIDIYALLAIAYHALTGSPPVSSNGNMSHVQQLHRYLSPEVGMLLAKGLAPFVQQRFQNVAELSQALLTIYCDGKKFVTPLDVPRQRRIPVSTTRSSQLAAVPSAPILMQKTLPSDVIAEQQEKRERNLPKEPGSQFPSPLSTRTHDLKEAFVWCGAIVACLTLLTLFAK